MTVNGAESIRMSKRPIRMPHIGEHLPNRDYLAERYEQFQRRSA